MNMVEMYGLTLLRISESGLSIFNNCSALCHDCTTICCDCLALCYDCSTFCYDCSALYQDYSKLCYKILEDVLWISQTATSEKKRFIKAVLQIRVAATSEETRWSPFTFITIWPLFRKWKISDGILLERGGGAEFHYDFYQLMIGWPFDP